MSLTWRTITDGRGTTKGSNLTAQQVDKNFQGILSDYATLEMFGAVGDGVTDDTVAIQKAVDSGFKLLGKNGSNYLISSTIIVTDNLYLTCNGKFTISPNGAFNALSLDNTTASATATLSADADAGDFDITLSSGSGVSVGDIMIAESDKLWYYDNRGTLNKGETSIVSGVSGSTVSLKYSIYDSYDISEETVTVKFYPSKRFYLANFDIEYASATSTFSFEARNYKESAINNVAVKRSYNAGAFLYGCADIAVSRFSAQEINGDGSAYGIWFGGCLNCSVSNSYFYNCRAGVDFSSISGYGPSRNGRVHGCIIDGSGESVGGNTFDNGWSAQRGIGTHGQCEYCYFHDNTIKNTRIGFYSRGRNNYAYNNEFINIGSLICRALYGTNLAFYNNFSRPLNYPDKDSPQGTLPLALGIKLDSNYCDTSGFTYIYGNNLYINGYLVEIDSNISNLYVKDNICDFNGSGTLNAVNSTGSFTVTNSFISDNFFYSSSGDSVNNYDSEITIDESTKEDIVNRNRVSELVVVNDDSVFTFTPQRVDGLIILSGIGGAQPQRANAVFHYRSDSADATEVSTGSKTTLSTGSTPPSGTTGSDDQLNIQVNNDNNIYVENRLGGAVSFYITAIS